jgi:hypothetical protein
MPVGIGEPLVYQLAAGKLKRLPSIPDDLNC